MLKMAQKCRFCECPVAEGGVLLSEVNQDALSSWWSKCLHTELDKRTLHGAWSCRMCVADARYITKNFLNFEMQRFEIKNTRFVEFQTHRNIFLSH